MEAKAVGVDLMELSDENTRASTASKVSPVSPEKDLREKKRDKKEKLLKLISGETNFLRDPEHDRRVFEKYNQQKNQEYQNPEPHHNPHTQQFPQKNY